MTDTSETEDSSLIDAIAAFTPLPGGTPYRVPAEPLLAEEFGFSELSEEGQVILQMSFSTGQPGSGEVWQFGTLMLDSGEKVYWLHREEEELIIAAAPPDADDAALLELLFTNRLPVVDPLPFIAEEIFTSLPESRLVDVLLAAFEASEWAW